MGEEVLKGDVQNEVLEKRASDTPGEYMTNDGDEFVTFLQAAELTGVTTRSVQRWREDVMKSDMNLFRNIFRRETLSSGGFRNRVSKRAVLERFKSKGPGILNEDRDRAPEKMRKEMLEVYKKVIENLEKERDTLKLEMEKKNEQIKMIEESRMRSDILLQQANDKMKVLEEPKKRGFWFWSR